MTEELFAKWLSRQLAINLKRLEKYGTTGRCEAISIQGGNLHSRGLQCSLPAKAKRDGHRVCGIHMDKEKAPELRFAIPNQTKDDYTYLCELMVYLSSVDTKFQETLRAAHAEATGTAPRPSMGSLSIQLGAAE